MGTNGYKSIQSILNFSNKKLGAISKKADILHDINLIIKGAIDPSLSDQVYVTNVHDGLITLTTSSPALATKCRLLTQSLIDSLQLHTKFTHIRHIQINVNTKFAPRTALNKTESKPLSQRAKYDIQKGAENIKDDVLREKLLKITEDA